VKTMLLIAASALLAACAGQGDKQEQSTPDQVQAVRDFIEVRQLEEVDAIASGSRDGWESIEDWFLIYTGRRAYYLVVFGRRCYELSDNTRIVADQRWESNRIRARFDTIRGCRIDAIYALTEAEVAELQSLGDAPGSRS